MSHANGPVWIVGAAGMLGGDLVEEMRARGLPCVTSDREVDITAVAAVRAFAREHRPAWIVNAAAYTAVDQAEKEIAAAFAINGDGPGNLGTVAAETGATVVHFSTDYVFDGSGTRPWVETDPTGPLSVYGKSKLEGERRLAAATDRFFLLRISWLYGVRGKNFVKTVVRLLREKPELRMIADQVGGPTWTRGLARNVAGLVARTGGDGEGADPATAKGGPRPVPATAATGEGRPGPGNSPRRQAPPSYGIYHYSDAGHLSWHEFALGIREAALAVGAIDRPVPIEAIPTTAYPLPAPRPANSRFAHDKVRAGLGFTVTPWRDHLAAFFAEWKAAGFPA